ncbi:chloramphenicol/florfenicol efflux MFS transporter FexA [Lactobacillus johnsonii]|uniref:chloramphenicol/florfenicol efflux MFS transporter FexA n=1 Tax=Lactobacillus johnsonii TaxID=33959 RepID=UPI00178190DB|nr:chloramphenicol/florfenicol efflux MFS transporter FexA [Lactobacillus johnsonii]QXL47418.1 chloramphenicol/florfenicol efflux MFS transporter FexA [Lactobacillus johnsonii]
MKKDSKSKEMIQSEKRGSTRLLMMVLSLSVLVGSITADSVNPVLPLISKALEASKSQVSWIVSGMALVLAIGVPIYGRISDFFELRKLYIFAIMILASGSLLCAIAPNLPLLVLGRMVQGAGMSAIPVLSVIAISKVFPQGKRGGALGIIAGTIGVGTAAGPIFGGVVGQYLGWNALFWFTFLLAIMIVIGAYYALPTIKPAESVGSNKNFDFIGGLFLGLTVGLLLFGITQGETSGFSSFSSLTSLIGSVVALVGFIWRIVTAENPFVPPVLFNNKDYVNTVIIAFFSMFAYYAVLVFVPLLVIEVNGLSSGQAGMILLPGSVAVAILSPFVGRLSDRFGDKRLIITGMTLMGLSTLFLSTYASGASPLLVSVGVLGVGIAFAFTNSPANNAAVSALDADKVGVGMGIFQGALYLGAGTGAGMIGALLSARRDATKPINPLYRLDAISYSDAFLAATGAILIALIAGLGLKKRG